MNQNAQNTAADLRPRLKAARHALEPEARRRGALLVRGRLFTWLATQRSARRERGQSGPLQVAAYWALADEIDLRALLVQWAADPGLHVSLPVVTGPGEVLRFRNWTPEAAMEDGVFGTHHPSGDEAPPPDVVLVPTLGYTRQGDRIGYGGGYYDRTLAALEAAGRPFVTIGIAWATGDLSGTPYAPAAHDVRLDAILTDQGWAVPAPSL